MRVVMVESTAKKVVFLRLAVRQLKLSAVSVVAERYERLSDRAAFHETFDAIVARAIRIAPEQLPLLADFLRPEGSLYLFATEGRSSIDKTRVSLTSAPLLSNLNSELIRITKGSIGQMTKDKAI